MSDGVEQAFLASLAGEDDVCVGPVAIVLAHPDDETIAVGAQLARLPGALIVHVTDGAPRNLFDATRHGFGTAADYAAARRRELERAAAAADVPGSAFVSFDVPDQEASYNLAEVARRLAGLFTERGTAVVLTHAYEGGHPDHDATAFAVHAARRLVARQNGGSEPLVLEMPLYRSGPEGWILQRFTPDPGHPELTLWLSEDERRLKTRMLESFATQRDVLVRFLLDAERFRVAPDYDFCVAANGGDLLYERQDWGVTGARWLDLATEALADLNGGSAA